MAFIYDLSDTWNNAGISFNGIKLNATDTASASGSKLIDLQINGGSKFTVGKTGAVIATGLIESTVGGFRFPDGTTQTTKATVNSVSGTGTVNGITLTGSVTDSGSLTLGGTLGNIANSQLTNSAITINGTSTPLGGSIAVGTVTSVGGTGTVSGLSLTGSITTSGSLTLGGTLVLTSGQVTDGLGYTPYNATNPAGYTTNVGTVTSVAGTGTVNGLTLTGSVTTSGSLTLGGTLGNIANSQLTNSAITINGTSTALGGSISVGTVTSVAALTLGTSGTDLASSVANGTTTPVVTLNVPTASATNRGALSPSDWSTFNAKQAALVSGTNIKTVGGASLLGSGDVGTIGLAYGGTGATTATDARSNLGLGSAAVLTAGVAGGVATLDGSGTVPTSQLPGAVLGGLNYQGTWNASTNTPTLASSTGSKGYYYVVSTAGSTNLDGVTDWKIGDWAVYDGTTWQKVDNTDAVSSVNGYTGAVVLTTSDVAQGTNLYFTQAAARDSVSAGTGISYDSTTGVITNSAPDQTVALTGAGTTTVTGTYPNFTITSNDSTVGTVTSVDLTAGTGVSVSGGPITSSGSITVTNTAPDQVVSLTGAGTTSVTGTYPNFTITSNDSTVGTVTSVAASGGTTGLTFTGSPITTAGTLTLGGTLAVANGGTGATTLTSGYALKGNGTSPVSASVLYDDGTNIGIGTTSPSALFHISQNGGGDIGALVSQTNGGNGTTARYRATHGSGAAFNLQAGNGQVDLNVTSNHHLTFGTNDTERFRIGTSGQFGIGGATYGSAGQVLTSGGASAAPTWTTPTTGTVTSVGGTGTVNGITLTGTVTSSGSLTLGGTLSGVDLVSQVTGTLPVANGGTGTTTAFTAGSVVFAGASGVYSQDNANLFWDNANDRLGIGTASPGTKFHAVGGNIWSSNFFEVGRFQKASGTGVTLGYDNSAYVATIGAYSHDGTASNLAFWTYPGSGSATERMRIDNNGNVGIGTSGPLSRLDVREANRADSTNIANVGVYTTTAQSTGVGGTLALGGLFNGSDNAPFASIRGGKQNSINNNYDGYLAFQTIANGGVLTEKMRIDSGGNVMIGGTTANSKLDVNGDITLRNGSGVTTGFAFNNSGWMDFAGSVNVNGVQVSHSTTVRFLTASTERMRITSSGDVAIGTTGLAYSFTGRRVLGIDGTDSSLIEMRSGGTQRGYIIGDANTVKVAAAGSNTLQFETNGAERARIDTSGNVGIGTSSPGSKLDVSGDVAVSWGNSGGNKFWTAFSNDYRNGMLVDGNNRVTQIFSTTAAGDAGGIITFSTRQGTASGASDYGTERMRIDSSGRLLVGTTSNPESSRAVFSGSSQATMTCITDTTSTSNQIIFRNPNGAVGAIFTSGTATTYSTSSDYRLKKIDGPVANSGAYIDALKPVQGSWKVDGSRFIGLLAHEVQEVSETPIATGEKDGEKMQAMDYSAPELIANLIAEIQSVRARLAELEGK